jgi:hypothetical protein
MRPSHSTKAIKRVLYKRKFKFDKMEMTSKTVVLVLGGPGTIKQTHYLQAFDIPFVHLSVLDPSLPYGGKGGDLFFYYLRVWSKQLC